jgi:biopolymer transport protein ExbD
MRLELDNEGDAALDMAPLIDVVFLLLIFFMVATSFAREEQQLDLDLPEARSAAPGDSPRELVLDLLPGGALRLDGQDLSSAELPGRLAELARVDSRRALLVRADRGLEYGRVVAVLDLCRLAGLTNAALATREG